VCYTLWQRFRFKCQCRREEQGYLKRKESEQEFAAGGRKEQAVFINIKSVYVNYILRPPRYGQLSAAVF
jgi:hypothetical protein